MDLGTMKYKLNTVQYKTVEEFVGDLRLVFSNCYTYNKEAAEEYKYDATFSISIQKAKFVFSLF